MLGMHRSGTSCVGNLLTKLGLYFGAPAISTGAGIENPKGFFERRDLRDVCDAILQGSGCDWWAINDFSPERVPVAVRLEVGEKFQGILAEMEANRPWFIKEPRLCLVWPVLRGYVSDPVFVHVWRHPIEVAQSLAVRNGFPMDFGIALWEAYVRAAHAASRGVPSLTICYNKLIKSPESETKRLVKRLSELGIKGILMPDASALRDAVEPELHRNRQTSSELDALLGPAQQRLVAALAKGKADDPALFEPLSAPARLRIADWMRREGAVVALRRQAAEAAKLRKELAEEGLKRTELRTELAERDRRRAELEKEIRRRQEHINTADQVTKISERLQQAWSAERAQLLAELAQRGGEIERLAGLLAQQQDVHRRALRVIRELEQSRRGWEDERRQLTSQLHSGTKEIERLTHTLATEKEQYQTAAHALEHSRTTWDAERRELAAQRDAQAEQVKSAEVRIAKEASAAAQMAARLADLEEDVRRRARYNEQIEGQFTALNKAFEQQRVESHKAVIDNSIEAARASALLRHGAAAGLKSFLRGTGARSPAGDKAQLSLIALHLNYRLICGRKDAADLVKLASSGLFDHDYYLAKYEDVAEASVEPLVHFVDFGAAEMRNPSSLFDTAYYLETNPDVATAGVNPLLHFITTGRQKGRLPRPPVPDDGAPGSASQPPQKPPAAKRSGFANSAAAQSPPPDPKPKSGSHTAASTIAVAPAKANGGATAARPTTSGAAFTDSDRASKLTRLMNENTSPYYKQFSAILKTSSGTSPNTKAAIDAMLLFDTQRLGTAARAKGPLVSIVMPVLNRAGLVVEAIESALAQTHDNFELLICDDGSTDGSPDVVRKVSDTRIKLFVHDERKGAAAARNTCLKAATGKYIGYLDSDNLWHPRYLESMVEALEHNEGRIACFARYFDLELAKNGPRLREVNFDAFHVEWQIEKPFVDLNSFVHRADAVGVLGMFDERLKRRQDYDLITRYTWLRDPIAIDVAFNIYRRIPTIPQITTEQKEDQQSPALIRDKIELSYRQGLDAPLPSWVHKVSVLSWDMSRNHFAKAYAVAEALSRKVEVELISFRFFDEEIFQPLAAKKPPFETKFFKGCDFPEFFGEMDKALNAITGDVIYAVKPRLPSLGLALLDNNRRGTPIMLEVNDLETVVHSPEQNKMHSVRPLEALGTAVADARSPYALIWSEVLDPLVAEIPVVFTHNRNLDRHYGNRCLYMRNVKNEREYATDGLDRNAIRASLGFSPDDKIILFGGLVRKHKGIDELLELLTRLEDPTAKLLIVGSRESPDLKTLRNTQRSDSVVFLPPQPPEEMAKINFASDIVLLWLDPAAPVSHFQMPYKLTDAIAMGPAVIGSPISDLPDLERAGAIWTVPFGDFDELVAMIRGIFSRPEGRNARRRRARKIFERQFSYGVVPANFALGAQRLGGERVTYDVSRRFAEAMESFKAALASGAPAQALSETPKISASIAPTLPLPVGKDLDNPVELIDITAVESIAYRDPEGIAVIMPCIDTEKGMNTAKLLAKRAGVACRIFVVNDTLRQGFMKTLNGAASQLDVKYLVYLAEDAFPGLDWLRIAYEKMEVTGKGLLAFNCGKWRGRVAAFGIVRKKWSNKLYGGPIFFEGYQAHKADNELTVIARVTDQFEYCADATLVEIDANKVFKENIPADKALFQERFRTGFDGTVQPDILEPLAAEYFVPLDRPATLKTSVKGTATAVAKQAVKAIQLKSDPQAEPFFGKPLTAMEIKQLRSEYAASKLANVPDTFALYRILGNDLPPRHKSGQSRANLQFILENEKTLEGCEKHFIVNRIHDQNEERAIIHLLEGHGASFIHIPFDPSAFSRIGFDLASLPSPDLLYGEAIEFFSDLKKQRLMMALYRLKNNYLMNNSGARNAALRDGKTKAKWVLPFDGNCFLTASAWDELRSDILAAPYLKYFVVPMARAHSNSDLLSSAFRPDPVEEPQLVFRKDAREEFDESFCYGRRPKVEMFWRLKIAGKWDAYKDDPWDQPRRPLSSEARQFGVAGWVARLSSGVKDLDVQDNHAADLRHLARLDAISASINQVNTAIAGVGPDRTTSLSTDVLATEIAATKTGSALASIVEQLFRSASEALGRGPYSVIDKITLPPSGNRNDYWHPAPYWWPNPKTADGLPYIRRDGERVTGTQMYEPESDKYDRTRLQRVFDDSLTLALAWKFSGDMHFADHGAKVLDRFFLNPATRMTPHLSYGQVRMGHNDNQGASTGIIEMKDLYFYLDAVRLLLESGAVSSAQRDALGEWLRSYLSWLLTSPQGIEERRSSNNHGTCYDLQVAAIAAFLGDADRVYETLARAQSRITTQFAPDGSQPDELKRTTTAHYCCFNFQSWINLAELASRWNVDLWSFETPSGAGLKQGARWLLGHMGAPWPYKQIDEFDADRFLPIWSAASRHIEGLKVPEIVPASMYQVKPIYFPHDGVRPFWNLGNACSSTGEARDGA